jgi:fucose permease
MLGPRGGDAGPAAYRRDRVTWAAFVVLLAFGVVNAGLGPALPYLRRAEHISYLTSVLHQVAFAMGGGLAGVLTVRARRMPTRAFVIRGGMVGAAAAWLALGYGDRLAITVAAAFVVSLLATGALIRIWALLADEHGPRRAVAMTEGEVAVSLGGVITPLVVGLMAGTALGWRGSFLLTAVFVALAVWTTGPVRLPPSQPAAQLPAAQHASSGPTRRVQPTLLLVVTIVAFEFALTFWLASFLGDSVGLSRRSAAALVSVLYLANLVGRALASRLARSINPERVLAGALLLAMLGLPMLLAATGAPLAVAGLIVVGTGVGATFPLTSALHVGASSRGADGALGQVLAAAAIGEVVGPVVVAGLAQAFGLRTALTTLAGFLLAAALALRWHMRQPR